MHLLVAAATWAAGADGDNLQVAVGPTPYDIYKSPELFNLADNYRCVDDRNTTTNDTMPCPNNTCRNQFTYLQTCPSYNSEMLENFLSTQYPLEFVHAIAATPNISMPDISQDVSFRMATPDDPACVTQYCPPMCTVLEMGYFGSTVVSNPGPLPRPATPEELQNGAAVIMTVQGKTYCGPMFGVVSPADNGQSAEAVDLRAAASFPQDRPVSVQYSPSTLAGAIIPLAKESSFPNWYYVNGYDGWRQAGELKSIGAPCYGRNIPRWMLPNTCRVGRLGCVNGYANYATHDDKKGHQYQHTLADPRLGLRGRFKTTDNAFDGSGWYDIDKDRYFQVKDRDTARKTFLRGCQDKKNNCTADAIALQFWNDPYFSIPAQGLNGFSPWVEDWSTEDVQITTPYFASYAAAAKQSSTGTFPYGGKPESPPQRTPRQTTGGTAYEQARLVKFTPQGMYSATEFNNGGTDQVREFYHPLFEFYIPNTTQSKADVSYFACSEKWLTNLSIPSKTCGSNDGTLASSVEWAASFLNVEQAMETYVTSKKATGSSTTLGCSPDKTASFKANKSKRKTTICCACLKSDYDSTGPAPRSCNLTQISLKYLPTSGNLTVVDAVQRLNAYFNNVGERPQKSGARKGVCSSIYGMDQSAVSKLLSLLAPSTASNYCPTVCRLYKMACFANCQKQWVGHLITPTDVIINYARKWKMKERAKSDSGNTVNDRLGDLKCKFDTGGCTSADLKAFVSAGSSMLDLTGKMLSHDRRQRAAIPKFVRDLGIGTLFFTGALVDGVAAAELGRQKPSAFATHTFEETSVDETVCDLTVCDIALDHSPRKDKSKDTEPFRCVPKQYAGALPYIGKGGFDIRFDNGNISAFCPRNQDGECRPGPEAQPSWWDFSYLTQSCLFGITDETQYCFPIPFDAAVRMGIPGGGPQSLTWRTVTPDYSKLSPHSTHADPLRAAFVQVPKDAGFSQRFHDNNAYPCDCGVANGAIVINVDEVDDGSQAAAQLKTEASAFYNPAVHALVRLGYSWQNQNVNGPNVGLYLTSTLTDLEIVERDVFDRDHKMLANETFDAFLSGSAPTSIVGNSLVYTRAAGNVTVCAPQGDADFRTDRCRGIRNEPYAREWVTTLSQSCARFPFGQLHRHQMSPELLKMVYGTNTSVRSIVYASDDAGFTPTVQGYCEEITFTAVPAEQADCSVNGSSATQATAPFSEGVPPQQQGSCTNPTAKSDTPLYRFCPNDQRTPAERTLFCTTDLLATHFVTGIKIQSRPASTSCDSTLKLCVLVPDYPGNDIELFTSSAEYAGYTLLITPFAFATLEYIFAYRFVSPVSVVTDDNPYLLKNPNNYTANDTTRLCEDNKNLGYAEDRQGFNLLSNLSEWLHASNISKTHAGAIAAIRATLDTFMQKSFPVCPTNSKQTSITVRVHNRRYDDSPTTCVDNSVAYPPVAQSNIAVTQPGMRVQAATSRPLQFGGERPGAATCARFLVSAINFTLVNATVDQTACAARTDSYHSTPVKFIGKNVSFANISMTTVAAPVSVALLGNDAEGVRAPTRLVADDVTLAVRSSQKPGEYHVAMARTSSNNVTVDCGLQACRVLTQPGMAFGALVYHRNVTPHTLSVLPCTNVTFMSPEEEATVRCALTDVSAYVGIFGSGFERIIYTPTNTYSVVATTLFIVMLTLSIAFTVIIGSLAFDRSGKVRAGLDAVPRPAAADLYREKARMLPDDKTLTILDVGDFDYEKLYHKLKQGGDVAGIPREIARLIKES